jgi:hypothetical protein
MISSTYYWLSMALSGISGCCVGIVFVLLVLVVLTILSSVGSRRAPPFLPGREG